VRQEDFRSQKFERNIQKVVFPKIKARSLFMVLLFWLALKLLIASYLRTASKNGYTSGHLCVTTIEHSL
jgi:hypothetical protein